MLRFMATSIAPSERGPSSSDHMWNRITTHGNVAGCWQVAGELAEPNAVSMLLDGPQMYGRTRCARCELAGRNGLPRWRRGPRPTPLCCCQRRNSCTLCSHTHTFYACRHILSLARATGRPPPATSSRAGGPRAGGPGEWGYDYNDSRDDELRRLRATALRCGCDLKRLLECKTTF